MQVIKAVVSLKIFWWLIKAIIALIWSIGYIILFLFKVNTPNPWKIMFQSEILEHKLNKQVRKDIKSKQR